MPPRPWPTLPASARTRSLHSLFAALALLLAASLQAEEPPRPALELAVQDGDQLELWRFDVDIDGQPHHVRWEAAMQRLFEFADSNQDGSLDHDEAARLPHPHSLRQTLWSRFVARSAPPEWETFDANGDDRIDPRELLYGYQNVDLDGVVVAIGTPPATAKLTAALLEHLQIVPGGRIEEPSWDAAVARLAALDRNGDDLISAGELVQKLRYPGAAATALLTPPRAAEPTEAPLAALPLAALPFAPAAELPPLTLLPRDKGGPLRKQPTEAVWMVRLNQHSANRPAVEQVTSNADAVTRADSAWLQGQAVWLRLQTSESSLAAEWRETRRQFLAQFSEVDAAGDGHVDNAQLVAHPKLVDLKTLYETADRNGDERLTHEELVAWLEVLDAVIRAQTLVAILDHGPGLFEMLDSDYNGALSTIERRDSWRRLLASGCIADGQLDMGRLPRQLRATVSRGVPTSMLTAAAPFGPAWFRAMDRNGDAHLSVREFLGPQAAFARYDRNRDDLISSEEASEELPVPEPP